MVKSLELPFPHDVTEGREAESWLLTVRGDGKATARFADGDVQGIDLREGDFILASAQAIYVSRSLEGTDARGNLRPAAPEQEKPRGRATKRAGNARKRS